MTQAINGSVTANYKYDGKGQRVIKTVGGITSIFIFDKDGKLIAEADSCGAVQKEYIYFASRPVAMAIVAGTPAIYYYHVDHLSTPQAMTDQSGAIVWAGDYEAFGEVSLTTSIIENNLRFPGQYYDSETDLHYNYFRDYDPAIGRYVESDPVGLKAGVNTYGYVLANPLKYSDFFGLLSNCQACKWNCDTVFDWEMENLADIQNMARMSCGWMAMFSPDEDVG